MLGLSVKGDVAKHTRWMTRFQKKQIPFATSVALNDTAFNVRDRTVKRVWPRAVAVRNRRFMSAALRVEKANKRKLTARVYDRLGRASLSKHVDGGRKTARSGRVAVPTTEVKRTSSGRVRRSQQPGKVLTGGKGFKTKLRSGSTVIMQRVGGKRSRRVKVLYTLHPSTRIKARFPFYREAIRQTRRTFPVHFRKALRRAMRTAR